MKININANYSKEPGKYMLNYIWYEQNNFINITIYVYISVINIKIEEIPALPPKFLLPLLKQLRNVAEFVVHLQFPGNENHMIYIQSVVINGIWQ